MKQMITAHSGCEGTDRDSLESIYKAIELNADAIEVDIRLDKNGNIKISHNAETEEVYKTKPNLEDVFEIIKDTNLIINCDIKEYQALYYLFDVSEKYGINRDRLIITGCTSVEQLVRDPELTSKAMVYVNIEEITKYDFLSVNNSVAENIKFYDPEDVKNDILFKDFDINRVIEYCKALNVEGVNIPYWILTEEIADKLNKANVLFSVWTVNETELARKIFKLNAKNITTRAVKAVLDAK